MLTSGRSHGFFMLIRATSLCRVIGSFNYGFKDLLHRFRQ